MGAEDVNGQEIAPVTGAEEEVDEQTTEQIEEAPKTVPLETFQKIEQRMKQLELDARNKDNAIGLLQTQLMQSAQARQRDEEPDLRKGYEDVDIPTMPDVMSYVDKAINAAVGKIGNTINERQDVVRRQELAIMESQARKDHSDYDDMIMLADEIVKKNPDLATSLKNFHNPFETAYSWAMSHPSYLEKIKSKGTTEAGEQIARNLNKQRTIAEVGGGGNPPSRPNFKDMAVKQPEKLQAMFDKLVRGF